jgi:hypothetical protein
MPPVRYEHHLHIESKAIRNRPWRLVCMLPVRYGYNLHINSKATTVTGSGGVCFL